MLYDTLESSPKLNLHSHSPSHGTQVLPLKAVTIRCTGWTTIHLIVTTFKGNDCVPKSFPTPDLNNRQWGDPEKSVC